MEWSIPFYDSVTAEVKPESTMYVTKSWVRKLKCASAKALSSLLNLHLFHRRFYCVCFKIGTECSDLLLKRFLAFRNLLAITSAVTLIMLSILGDFLAEASVLTCEMYITG